MVVVKTVVGFEMVVSDSSLVALRERRALPQGTDSVAWFVVVAVDFPVVLHTAVESMVSEK